MKTPHELMTGYRFNVGRALIGFAQVCRSFQDSARIVKLHPHLFLDQRWREAVERQLAMIDTGCNFVTSLQPTEDDNDLHWQMITLAGKLRFFRVKLAEGIAHNDLQMVTEATAAFNQAGLLLRNITDTFFARSEKVIR